MSLLIWSHVYSVGVEIVDEQHKVLMGLINEIHDMQMRDDPLSNMNMVLHKLVDYTIYHFQTEQKLFQELGYPEHEEHKGFHDKLIEEVSGFVKLFESGDAAAREKLMLFLTDWLKDHILGEDKKFGKYHNAMAEEDGLENL